MNNKKEKDILVITIVIALSICLLPYLFQGKAFITGYDVRNQHIPLYTEYRNIIYSKQLPFWSHNLFLGTDFWSSKSFYLLGDVFSLIVLALPMLEVEEALLVAQLCRFVFCILVTYKLLKKLGISFYPALSLSLAYSFSSWLFLFYGMPTFASTFALFPLLILSIECFLKENKRLLVIAASFLLVSANYYLFWSISVFMVFYWPTRYLLYKEFDFKDAFFKSLELVILYSLGVALSAPLLLPTVLFMMHNPRVGSPELALLHPVDVYFGLFVKTVSAGFYANKEVLSAFTSGNYRLDQIGLFVTSFALVALPQFFYLLDNRRRKVALVAATGLMFMLATPVGGSIFHGLSESSFRWVFTLDLLLVMASAYVLDHNSEISHKLLFISLALVAGISLLIALTHGLAKYHIQFILMIISIFLMVIYVFSIRNKILTSIIIILEVSFLGLTSNLIVPEKYISGYQYDNISPSYFADLDDSEYYRIYIDKEYQDIDFEKDFCYNSNLALGYKGVASYDSTYQSSISSLLRNFDEEFWWFRLSTHELLNVLSVKYIVVANEWEADYYDAEIIEEIENSSYYLCLNRSYKSFGYTNNNIFSLQEFAKLDYIWDKDMVIGDALIVDDDYIERYGLDQLTKVESHHISDLSYTNNHMEFDLETSTNELLYLSIAYDEGWSITADGKKVESFPVNCGLTGILIPEGAHHIEMTFAPKGIKEGTMIAAVAALAVTYVVLSKKRFH